MCLIYPICKRPKIMNINIDYNRPKRVSMKSTPMIETLYDFHIKFKNKLYYDYVIILQPTSPLRKKNDIQIYGNPKLKSALGL